MNSTNFDAFDMRTDLRLPLQLNDSNYSLENYVKCENNNSNLYYKETEFELLNTRKKRKWKADTTILSSKKLRLEANIEPHMKNHKIVTEESAKCPQSPPHFNPASDFEPRRIHQTRITPVENRTFLEILRNEVMNTNPQTKKKHKVVDLQFRKDLLVSYINSPCSRKQLEDTLRETSDVLENNPRAIFITIIEILKKTDECLDYNGQYSNSPRLPNTVKKILLYLQGTGEKTLHSILKFLEEFLFSTESHKHDILICMNLTHLLIGLLDLNCKTDHKNKARLYVAKCFYFYTDFAYPMVHQLILAFPGILPSNGDTTYDRSDALINTIQCILMNTYYGNSGKQHLRMMKLFNLLTYRYKYQPMKPSKQDLIQNLISKIKAGKTKNVSLCFAIFCRRNEPNWNKNWIVEPCLLPLLTEYYKALHNTDANDKKISCLLETISLLIKPINITSDISNYLNIFSQFVGASVYRKTIQDAALLAILRLSRFGYMNCYNVIKHFNPSGMNLERTTKAALKTFLYTKQIKT